MLSPPCVQPSSITSYPSRMQLHGTLLPLLSQGPKQCHRQQSMPSLRGLGKPLFACM